MSHLTSGRPAPAGYGATHLQCLLGPCSRIPNRTRRPYGAPAESKRSAGLSNPSPLSGRLHDHRPVRPSLSHLPAALISDFTSVGPSPRLLEFRGEVTPPRGQPSKPLASRRRQLACAVTHASDVRFGTKNCSGRIARCAAVCAPCSRRTRATTRHHTSASRTAGPTPCPPPTSESPDLSNHLRSAPPVQLQEPETSRIAPRRNRPHAGVPRSIQAGTILRAGSYDLLRLDSI